MNLWGSIVTVAVFLGTSVHSVSGAGLTALPPNLEAELALSALPAHLRDEATVYRFDPDVGYTVARTGRNGFHAIVARIDPGAFRGDWTFDEFRDDILLPIGFDSEGARTNLQVFLETGRMYASGVAPAAMKRSVREGYESGGYPALERVGVAYMLAPVIRGYPDPDNSPRVATLNIPHYMILAPNVTNSDVGAHRAHLNVIQQGPHGYLVLRSGPVAREAINAEFARLISELCDFREDYCLESR